MSESKQKTTVRLLHPTGAGAYGTADDYREAYLIAWREWRRAFGGKKPVKAQVQGTDRGPIGHWPHIAPPLLVVLRDEEQTFDPVDDEDDVDFSGYEDDNRAFMAEAFEHARAGDLHEARDAIRLAVLELLSLDETLRQRYVKR